MNDSINTLIEKYKISNFVDNFIGKNYNQKLALIGQDPGITTKNNRVKKVLMLDDKHSRLYQYISKDILDPLHLSVEGITAINLIPVPFSTSIHQIAKEQQIDFYSLVYQMAEYYYPVFLQKLDQSQPQYLITLGKPVFEFLKRKAHLSLGEIREVFARPFPLILPNQKYPLIPGVPYNSRFRKPYIDQKYRLKQILLHE